jgi:hypothetical protein
MPLLSSGGSRMTRARISGLLVLAAALLATGCIHKRSIIQDSAFANGEITLVVVNHNWLDVSVYLVRGTARERVGTATAASTSQFVLPLRRLGAGGDFRLLADPIGGRRTFTSETLHGQDGDIVTWTLEDNLSRSTVTIR